MTQEQSALMLRIQQLGLTMDDLGQYLDTHPADSFAIERYQMTAEQYKKLSMEYSVAYGPLLQMYSTADSDTWLWAETAFPWND